MVAEGIELWRWDCGCGKDGPCWHYSDRDPARKMPGAVEKLIAYPATREREEIEGLNRLAAAAHGHGLGRVPSEPS